MLDAYFPDHNETIYEQQKLYARTSVCQNTLVMEIVGTMI